MDTKQQCSKRGGAVLPYLPSGTLDPWSTSRADGDGAWHVLHVRSRQEKALSGDLSAMGIAHYLPIVRETRYYGRRKATIEAPLFPGYLFLLGTLDDAYEADRTKRVARLIQVADQRQLDWELRNLRMALSQQATLDPYPFLKKGMRVEVRSGPLRGLQGVVEDRSKADRLVLQVQMLGTAASVEVHGAVLEALS